MERLYFRENLEKLFNRDIMLGNIPTPSELGIPSGARLVGLEKKGNQYSYFENIEEAEPHLTFARQALIDMFSYLGKVRFVNGTRGASINVVLEELAKNEDDLNTSLKGIRKDSRVLVRFVKDARTLYHCKLEIDYPSGGFLKLGTKIGFAEGALLRHRQEYRFPEEIDLTPNEITGLDIPFQVTRYPLVINTMIANDPNQRLDLYFTLLNDILVHQMEDATSRILKERLKEYNGDEKGFDDFLVDSIEQRHYESDIVASSIVKNFLFTVRDPDGKVSFNPLKVFSFQDEDALEVHNLKSFIVTQQYGAERVIDFYRNSRNWDFEKYLHGDF